MVNLKYKITNSHTQFTAEELLIANEFQNAERVIREKYNGIGEFVYSFPTEEDARNYLAERSVVSDNTGYKSMITAKGTSSVISIVLTDDQNNIIETIA